MIKIILILVLVIFLFDEVRVSKKHKRKIELLIQERNKYFQKWLDEHKRINEFVLTLLKEKQ